MKKNKVNGPTGVYKYLEESGALEKTPEDIENAKALYWQEYRKQWKKNKRKKEKAFLISFKPDELKEITEAAKACHLDRTRFVKAACLSFVRKRYCIPSSEITLKIKSLMSLNYSALQELTEMEKLPYFIGIQLLERMGSLENTVLDQLTNIKLLQGDH